MTNKIEISRELLNDLLDSARLEVDERVRSFGEGYRPHVLAALRKMVADTEAILAAPAVERQESVACSHEWTDDGEFTLICTKCGHEENHEHSEFESRIGGKLMGNRHGERLVRDSYGTYRDPKVRTLWMGWQARANLTSPSAPVAVVLPERKPQMISDAFARGWNACLDKVKEMNQ